MGFTSNLSPVTSVTSYKISMLSEMAKSLGYKDLKQTEIDATYYPQLFVEREKTQNELINENLRVLKHSKSCAESFTDEEDNNLYPKK